MPLDISLDDIERHTAYRVNRIGRACLSYNIIHQAKHVHSYKKVDITVVGKKLFNVFITALLILKIFSIFYLMLALNLFSYLELCLIKTARELSFNLIDIALFILSDTSIRIPEEKPTLLESEQERFRYEVRKSGQRVGRKIRPPAFSRFTQHPVYRPRERLSRGTLVDEDIPTSGSRGSERRGVVLRGPPPPRPKLIPRDPVTRPLS